MSFKYCLLYLLIHHFSQVIGLAQSTLVNSLSSQCQLTNKDATQIVQKLCERCILMCLSTCVLHVCICACGYMYVCVYVCIYATISSYNSLCNICVCVLQLCVCISRGNDWGPWASLVEGRQTGWHPQRRLLIPRTAVVSMTTMESQCGERGQCREAGRHYFQTKLFLATSYFLLLFFFFQSTHFWTGDSVLCSHQ